MNTLRRLLTEGDPFRIFQLHCSQCDEIVIEANDLTECPLKNEVLVLHKLTDHTKNTGHNSFNSTIELRNSFIDVDATIDVNS